MRKRILVVILSLALVTLIGCGSQSLDTSCIEGTEYSNVLNGVSVHIKGEVVNVETPTKITDTEDLRVLLYVVTKDMDLNDVEKVVVKCNGKYYGEYMVDHDFKSDLDTDMEILGILN